ncbi:MAG: hypothetical protein ACI89L_002042 [Phycisphaerales bacterium]|jgi:hypothetical protein
MDSSFCHGVPILRSGKLSLIGLPHSGQLDSVSNPSTTYPHFSHSSVYSSRHGFGLATANHTACWRN